MKKFLSTSGAAWIFAMTVAAGFSASSQARGFAPIKYGDFDHWYTRNIKESKLLGGATRQCYAIAPDGTDNSGKAYTNRGGSPWGSSNVLAKPAGIVKVSNAVYPENRPGHGKCAKLVCQYEHCKVMGMVNLDVIAGGTIFLGQMIEPIKSTSNPYSKIDMGVPFTYRPQSLQFDYKVSIPEGGKKVYSSGFGKKKEYAGADHAEAMVVLQRRWEDKDGNIYAKRIGSGRQTFGTSMAHWRNGHRMPIVYGQAGAPVPLFTGERAYYARNSKGKMKPVKEVGWEANGTPTHAIVMFSASSGEAYTGTPGLTMWVDNVGFWYE